MSKKIQISIPNKIRPNLYKLFHEYISRKSIEEKERYREGNLFDDGYEGLLEYWDREFPGWDESSSDDGEILYPLVFGNKNKKKKKDKTPYESFWDYEEKKGKKKHSKSSKKRKAKLFDISVPYNGEEEDELNFDDVELRGDVDLRGFKEIWFYPDYHDKEDRLEFNSLLDFNDFCTSMGYTVSDEVADDILYRYESHCCLNPEAERYGLLDIMSEHSYGDMFYEACEEHELSEV